MYHSELVLNFPKPDAHFNENIDAANQLCQKLDTFWSSAPTPEARLNFTSVRLEIE